MKIIFSYISRRDELDYLIIWNLLGAGISIYYKNSFVETVAPSIS